MNSSGRYRLLKTEHFHKYVKMYNLKDIGYEGRWEVDKNNVRTLQIFLDGMVYPKSKKEIRRISKVYYSICMKYYLDNDKELIPEDGFFIEIFNGDKSLLVSLIGNNPYGQFVGNVELN